jgi:hypothetical protein
MLPPRRPYSTIRRKASSPQRKPSCLMRHACFGGGVTRKISSLRIPRRRPLLLLCSEYLTVRKPGGEITDYASQLSQVRRKPPSA